MHIFVTNDDGVAAPGIRYPGKSTLRACENYRYRTGGRSEFLFKRIVFKKADEIEKAAKLWRKHRSISF